MMSKRWIGPTKPSEQENSILKELEERGYDLSTLRFSIKKKKPPETEG